MFLAPRNVALLGGASQIVTPWAIYGANLAWWHDLQDPTTRFSDFIGTPAVAGDRVQLLMDKAAWQGRTLVQELAQQAEKIVNGSGTTGDLTSFVNGGGITFSVSGGAIQMARNGATGAYLSLPSTPVGTWVKLSARISKTSGTGSNRVFISSGIGTTILTGPDVVLYAPLSSANLLSIWCDDTTTIGLDDVSVKAIPGANAYQSGISGLRPLLQLGVNGAYYLEPDGLDDFMVTSPLDLSSTDKGAVFTAARKLSDASASVVVEFSASAAANAGGFTVGAGTTSGDASRRTWFCGHSTTGETIGGAGIYPAPDTRVISALYNRAGATQAEELALRLNGVAQTLTYNNAFLATGNYGNYPLYYFRRGGASLPFQGYFWGAFGVKGIPTAAQIAQSEALLNRYAQAY